MAKLNDIRKQELNALKATANTRAILISVLSTAPSLVAVLTLGMYALLGNVLDPTKVFTALALFNQLRFPLIFFPMLLNTLAEGRVSLERLTNFLLAAEIQGYVETEHKGSTKGEYSILVENGTFSWNLKQTIESSDVQRNSSISAKAEVIDRRGSLVDTNIQIKRGELVAIVGPTGSGKSTVLNALLGELVKESGSVFVQGRVAYVSQSSWIPNDTLRNVILFGKPMDLERYKDILRCSGLERDLAQLENGDLTEIGERGINLSGGQKQRVAIARALYDDADIYLFDDPLSALDNEVGGQVFQQCIKGDILQNKTRILVTHQLGVLSEVDKIIVMDKTDFDSDLTIDSGSRPCRILDQGTLSELLARGRDLSKYVQQKEPQKPQHSDTAANGSKQQSLKKGDDVNLFLDSSLSRSTQSAQNESDAEDDNSSLTDVESIETYSEKGRGDHSSVSSYDMDHLVADLETTSVQTIANETAVTANSPAAEMNEMYINYVPPTGAVMDCLDSDCNLFEEFNRENIDEVDSSEHSTSSLFPEAEAMVDHGVSFEDTSVNRQDHSVAGVEDDLSSPSPAKLEKAVDTPTKGTRSLMSKEERGEGAVSFDIYKSYFLAANKPLMALLIVASFALGNTRYEDPSYGGRDDLFINLCFLVFQSNLAAMGRVYLDQRCRLCKATVINLLVRNGFHGCRCGGKCFITRILYNLTILFTLIFSFSIGRGLIWGYCSDCPRAKPSTVR